MLPGLGQRWSHYAAIGVTHRDGLYGGVVFHDYNPRAGDIHITAAFKGARWCLPRAMRAIFDYPTRQLKCRRATMLIAADNHRAREFAARIGFKVEGILRHGHDGTIDRLLYGILLPEELRFPGGHHE